MLHLLSPEFHYVAESKILFCSDVTDAPCRLNKQNSSVDLFELNKFLT